jgi:Thermophilic metalloprotease (M29)
VSAKHIRQRVECIRSSTVCGYRKRERTISPTHAKGYNASRSHEVLTGNNSKSETGSCYSTDSHSVRLSNCISSETVRGVDEHGLPLQTDSQSPGHPPTPHFKIIQGPGHPPCLKDGDSLTPEQLASRGANSSLIHVDWMIGSNRIDVDGISAAGGAEAVMRGGEWV